MILNKFLLYLNTIRYMKPSQIYHRLRKMLNLECTLGAVPEKRHEYGTVHPIRTVPELDFDRDFLMRFPVDELMNDRITLMYEAETFHWEEPWLFSNRTPLWNYNLHYFEYAFPIIQAYRDKGDAGYIDKLKRIMLAWIRQNPRGSGTIGWDPYPTAMRLTNWLSVYTYLESEIKKDIDFNRLFIRSVWEQYDSLAHHLEKDLLSNHYFENLKALLLCSLFFKDSLMQEKALKEMHKQCREQIMADGVHFELSPMYHKIIFEGLLRVTVALQGAGERDMELEAYLHPMLDAAYSLEEGLERIPLFNDCGSNVAKSLGALCEAAGNHFGLAPEYKDKFPDSGYYIFKRGDWKLIVDAGQPGPAYIPGHVHCDAMSYELFKSGKPVLVNCGTYAYQCGERGFFRSTAAHNTVMVDDVEQSQCWVAFRLGKRSRVKVLCCGDGYIKMLMRDQKGNRVIRTVKFTDSLLQVSDISRGNELRSWIHFTHAILCDKEKIELDSHPYAPEFGEMENVAAVGLCGQNSIKYQFNLKSELLTVM